MKKITFLLTVTILFGVTAILAFAQTGNKSDVREKIKQLVFNRVSAKLNLTNDQQAKAKSILENAKTRVQPLVEQLKANHQQIEKLGTDGVYNEQKAKEFADKETEIGKQLFLEKEKTKAELFAILTPEQREQAIKMIENVKSKIKNRKGFGSGEILDKILSEE